jgi:hypothetical protein
MVSSIRSGTVPTITKTVTETATVSAVDPVRLQRAAAFAATVNAAEAKPLGTVSTGELQNLVGAYFSR